ncbi:MAG: HAD family hydrolase [Microgenomates group bacterium]
MIKLILVDFDDTLCLSEEACFHLENEIAEKLGFTPMSRTVHQANWGKPLKDAIVERIPGIDGEKFMGLFAEVSRKYVDQGTFDHISEENLGVLRQLRENGYKVVIQTSRQHCEVEYLVSDRSPLAPVIDGFFYQERSQYKKPDPRVFLLPSTSFHVSFQEMVYVGDAFTDVQWCKAAGIHFIASLESGLRTKEDFEKLGATMFIHKFAELPERIEELDTTLAKEPQAFTSKAIL